jgi:DNA-directed RNA polymerase subunit RPC12/RpoP
MRFFGLKSREWNEWALREGEYFMKKSIICLRCGKREGVGKSHERITFKKEVFYLCVDCAQIVYKLKDAVIEKNKILADELVHDFEFLLNNSNEVLISWFDEYKIRIGL